MIVAAIITTLALIYLVKTAFNIYKEGGYEKLLVYDTLVFAIICVFVCNTFLILTLIF
jgi:hypothetical protein